MSTKASIACNRFGLGATEGDISRVSGDPEGWLSAQLESAATNEFRGNDLRSSDVLLSDLMQARKERRRAQQSGTEENAAKSMSRLVRGTIRKEVAARTMLGAQTSYPFHERLARFWANHFTVAAKNPQTTIIVGAYEREAIRPHILGTFEDLALSAIFHPGMLIYLDNVQSIGPNSRIGRRRDRGLNENLAREVLELHTVTPQSGYTQDDVTELARALTGWTVGNARFRDENIGRTIFADRLHETGTRRVLSNRYTDTGDAQATKIISDLCKSRYTAQHIAHKLAKHFTADTPPSRLVDELEMTFLETGGDLNSLYSVLINAPEAWVATPQKVKTPDDLLTSTSRLMGINAVFAGDPRSVFTSLAQQPFTAPSPKGWSDSADDWIGPDALSKRIEWANRVALRNQDIDARTFLGNGLGAMVSEATAQAVARAESPSQALTLALMSPDFQRR